MTDHKHVWRVGPPGVRSECGICQTQAGSPRTPIQFPPSPAEGASDDEISAWVARCASMVGLYLKVDAPDLYPKPPADSGERWARKLRDGVQDEG